LAVRGLALGPDAFEELRGGLVSRVLIYEAALEGPLENGLAEAATPSLGSAKEFTSIICR
jgi:hypothetical protein